MAKNIWPTFNTTALAVDAQRASMALADMLEGDRSKCREVRSILDRLDTSSDQLRALCERIPAPAVVDVSNLELILQRFAEGCKEFERQFQEYGLSQDDSAPSLFARMKSSYLGNNIEDFIQLLAAYNLAFEVVLADLAFCRTLVSAGYYRTYKGLTLNTSIELNTRCLFLMTKLDSTVANGTAESSGDQDQQNAIKLDILSAKVCLVILASFSDELDRAQLDQTHPIPITIGPNPLPGRRSYGHQQSNRDACGVPCPSMNKDITIINIDGSSAVNVQMLVSTNGQIIQGNLKGTEGVMNPSKTGSQDPSITVQLGGSIEKKTADLWIEKMSTKIPDAFNREDASFRAFRSYESANGVDPEAIIRFNSQSKLGYVDQDPIFDNSSPIVLNTPGFGDTKTTSNI